MYTVTAVGHFWTHTLTHTFHLISSRPNARVKIPRDVGHAFWACRALGLVLHAVARGDDQMLCRPHPFVGGDAVPVFLRSVASQIFVHVARSGGLTNSRAIYDVQVFRHRPLVLD